MSGDRIRIGASEIAELTRTSWNLLSTSTGCELVISFNTSLSRDTPEDVFFLLNYGIFTVSTRQKGGARLGIAHFDEPYVIQGRRPGTANARLGLSPEDLARLEEFRQGHDLFFEFRAQGWGYLNGDWQMGGLDTDVRAPKSDWIGTLQNCGAPLTLFYEVPFLLPSDDRAIHQAVTQINNAHRQLAEGRYEDAVAYCRDVFEKIVPLYFGEDPKWSQIYSLLHNRESREGMDESDREKAIWALCRHFTHLAHHNKSPESSKFDRSQTQLIVMLTASLLSHASRKI